MVLVSLEYGLQNIVMDQIKGSESSRVVSVTSERSKILRLKKDHISKFSSVSGVESVEEVINLFSKINYHGFNLDVSTYGVTPNYFDISRFDFVAGSALSNEETDAKNIVINTKLAETLGSYNPQELVEREMTVSFVIDGNMSSQLDKSKITSGETYQVKGVVSEANNPAVYVLSESLYQNQVDYLSQAKVVASDTRYIEEVRYQIEEMGFKTSSIQDTLAEVNRIFNLIKILLGVVSIITLFIAITSILNTLAISVIQRTPEVGFLRILGIRERDIKYLLMGEAVILSFSGVMGGILIGLLINFGLELMVKYSGTVDQVGQAFSVTYLPPSIIILLILLAGLIGLATGYYPAQRAIKISPLEALRTHK